MIKQSIRIAGFILALFALILVFKHTHMMQEEKPLGTTERFNLTLLSTDTSKEQLVNELNDLVDQYHAVLVKVVPNQDDYSNQRDIIWFGSHVPAGNSPKISDNQISWLEPSVGGMLIHSSGMGVRPLYGSYSMLGSAEFKAALKEWCSQNEMSIDFYKEYPFVTVFLAYFIQHGIGNAVLISFFLLLTTIIVWFVTHAKSRALRLLGGISPQRIHFEDTLTIISLATQGFLMGCAAFLIYLCIVSGINQLSLIHLIGISIARESDRICLCGLRSCKGSRGRADERGKCHKDCKQSGHSALENFLFHSFCPPSDMKKAPYFYDAHFGILN